MTNTGHTDQTPTPAWVWGTDKTHGIKPGDTILYGGKTRKAPQTPPLRMTVQERRYGGGLVSAGVATRYWAAPLPAVAEIDFAPTEEEAQLPADARRVLDLLNQGAVEHPTDITEEMQSVNHRYARELLGMLVVAGLAAVADPIAGLEHDVWVPTDRGRELADANRRTVQLSLNAHTGHSPKEHTMASTKPKTTSPKATKASTPSAPRFCGCGCGTQVAGKSLFRQGHDARLVSQSAAEITAETQIPARAAAISKAFGGKLGAKFASAASNRLAKAASKAEYLARPKPAPKAKTPKAAKPHKQVEAKVGRWTKTGHVTAEGDFITTNAKGAEIVVSKGSYELIK